MKRIYRVITMAVACIMLASCAEDFTNRPPEDAITLDSYYATDEQVASATNGMYSRTWFQFHNKFFFAVAEVGSGNMYSGSSDVSAMRNFSLNGSDAELNAGWGALWANIAQANSIINFLADRVGPGVSPAVLDNTIGEAYFMRATAYFYLVRLWGAVPIIENNLDYVTAPQINTNRVEDVYHLIEMDYQAAIERLVEKNRGSNYSANGHVSKGSAKAMLAKVYLYEQKYPEAKALAAEVINSNEFKLLGGDQVPGKTFGDLFTYPNNNNEESIFALQWVTDGNYGSASNCNTQFGISTAAVTTSNASYGGVFAPSQDVIDLYDAGDVRKHETIMFPGDSYPNMKVMVNGTTPQVGFTVPSAADIGGQGAGIAIKKYCQGIVNGNATGPIDAWAMMENNTYIMRYAELLLIHAEATLAGGGSTSDAAALESFNAVRNRAGLASLTSITFDDIFLERRRELCFEGDFWFDLGRIPRAEATAIMAAQNRGNQWTAEYFTPDSSDFLLDYPDNEVSKNPKLLEDPVPYSFD
ncbi:carbohydrate-binding protein SusD [Flavobacterium akiainvivens]|uniref:Carbohydrate-binding protein SusD n=1 Tax=Flavobacterium akiainvivens TaxID=1202724 RepID=A0A0M8M8R1_9FLAO|nr:RagB/SusD family nutrient uptake outer membrane protein [Flavobacterium akiainvivens]KOS05863.1 carbohydrate-binding protein SusD [Flavobacterium akiainvivens]SFQ56639.1 Starch-binding associating with outer membrane [Flavobacterium akiainvivens]